TARLRTLLPRRQGPLARTRWHRTGAIDRQAFSASFRRGCRTDEPAGRRQHVHSTTSAGAPSADREARRGDRQAKCYIEAVRAAAPLASELHRIFTEPSQTAIRNRDMSRHLVRDMERIHREVLTLSGFVEEMIDRATIALCDRSDEMAREVVDSDAEVDQREVQIEEDCLKILALHQPVAGDLRRIATVLKVNNDLERIADLAVNISQRARAINRYPQFPIPDDVRRMAALATRMVRSAMDAFVNLDAD